MHVGEDGVKLKRAQDDNKVTRARTPARWEGDGKLTRTRAPARGGSSIHSANLTMHEKSNVLSARTRICKWRFKHSFSEFIARGCSSLCSANLATHRTLKTLTKPRR